MLAVQEKLEIKGEYHIVIGLFPYFVGEKKEDIAIGQIAPFARQNHYKELIQRMKRIIRSAPPPLSDLTKKQYRLFCNSGLPEKELAHRAGLGFLGKNSLLISPDQGSRCLIAGMILPAEIPFKQEQGSRKALKQSCGSCRLCEKACPGGAISESGFSRESCLQSWATDPRPVPDQLKEQWGHRIYGCTNCQDVCPWNRKRPEGHRIERGSLPSEIPLEFLLTAHDEEIKSFFKGSTMGMSWIKPETLRRNAAICAASGKREDLLPQLKKILSENPDPALQNACIWALKKITTTRE